MESDSDYGGSGLGMVGEENLAIAVAELGNDAGMLGAAKLAWQMVKNA